MMAILFPNSFIFSIFQVWIFLRLFFSMDDGKLRFLPFWRYLFLKRNEKNWGGWKKITIIAPSINSLLHFQHNHEYTISELNWLGLALSAHKHFIGSIFHICIIWNNLCVHSLYYNALRKGKNETITITTSAAAEATTIKLGIENIHVHITFKSFQEQCQCTIGQRK